MSLSFKGYQESELRPFYVISCRVLLIILLARPGSYLFFKYDAVFEKMERANKGAR